MQIKGVYSPKQDNRINYRNNENIQQIKSITEQQLKFSVPQSLKYKILLRVLEMTQVIEKIQKSKNSLKILNDLKQEIEILLEKNKNNRAENILLQRLLNEIQNIIIEIQKRLLKKMTNNINSVEVRIKKFEKQRLQYDLMDLKERKNQLVYKAFQRTQE